MLHVSVAGKVLFEAGELSHPFRVVQKVGEVLEALGGVTHALRRAQNIEVVNRFEHHEVREGDLITTDELVA